MALARVARVGAEVAATRSRKTKIEVLAELLGATPREELPVLVPWLCGELRQGKIGVGYAALSEAIRTVAAPASSLMLAEVDAAFGAIGGLSGPGSSKARKEALAHLFARATRDEQQLLAALMAGELRQGALAGVLAEAVAAAGSVPADAVRRAAMLSGDLVHPALAAMMEGADALAAFDLTLFRPVQPMLADTADDVEQALASLGAARLETKLDGARVQVHRRGEEVRVYTRALLPVTDAVPEVVELARALPVDEIVLDGETIALDASGRPHPFQTTMRRFGRKLDVEEVRAELPLSVFFFDVLQVDGRVLVDAPLTERLAELERVVPAHARIEARTTDDPEEARAFLQSVLDQGHEGLMAKSPASPYEAGHRGSAWLKLKPAWTLDLVILAVEWGSGRRQGWLSNLHLGARDPGTGGYVMLGKTFKGLTDEMLAWQTRELLAREVRREGHVVHVRPELVAEVAFQDVQTSPRYPGGMALRLARVKAYRPDKGPADADTVDTVRAIHAGRARRRA
ncbi:MAG: ATP-dependent DNA ligase [Alphaproteobacteria bacterium]|nr:ATP-dependent DNA ligase [Alphaproteobacteria bacterium]MCB9700041.1 ATP-dependent DNA ligase [Alphaproteobacteria bacterium]